MTKKARRAGPGPLRIISYTRVSLDKQAREGMSLDDQETRIRGLAASKGAEVVGVIREPAKSGGNLERPGLRRALAMLKRGEADALAVADLSRLTRSVADLAELVRDHFDDGKAALLSCSEDVNTASAGGRMVLNVITAISQWERERIGERTQAAMLAMQRSGTYTGGQAPYGWKLVDDRLVRVPAEQKVIARARELVAEGASMTEVAEQLGEEGVRTRVVLGKDGKRARSKTGKLVGGDPPTRVQVERMVAERAYDEGLVGGRS